MPSKTPPKEEGYTTVLTSWNFPSISKNGWFIDDNCKVYWEDENIEETIVWNPMFADAPTKDIK